MCRDQSGNCCQSSGHREHPAVSADAQVLERKTFGFKATGEVLLGLDSFPTDRAAEFYNYFSCCEHF